MSYERYRAAALTLWGDAGALVLDEQRRLNDRLFNGELPPLPIVIGITAYGRCIGLTRATGYEGLPRITIASNLFKRGTRAVVDTLTHELVHAKLMLEDRCPDHNSVPWCEEITRLSPMVLGCEINAAPQKNRRVVVDGRSTVRRAVPDGCLSRKQLAGWPGSLRPAEYPSGDVLMVDTY